MPDQPTDQPSLAQMRQDLRHLVDQLPAPVVVALVAFLRAVLTWHRQGP